MSQGTKSPVSLVQVINLMEEALLPIYITHCLTLLDAGGGSRSPPYHINVVPRKMLKERVADFFLLFLNMWMECWRLLFAVKYHLVWPGEGKSVQNWPSFIRGDPVGSNRKAKWLTQIVASCNMLHVTFGFFLCCNLEGEKVNNNDLGRRSPWWWGGRSQSQPAVRLHHLIMFNRSWPSLKGKKPWGS